MATGRLAYCTLSDVVTRLYAAQSQVNLLGQTSSPAANTDAQRDTLLQDLIQDISRRFDRETGRTPEAFAPKYEQRLYSGKGSQLFEVEDFATLSKVEINTTPGNLATPTWTDYTTELTTTNNIQARPVRFFPKNQLFRMSTFYQDPFLAGNVRLTGVWGEVQPDSAAAQPTAPWFGQTAPQIAALAPAGGGWWIVPEDVKKAVAEWVVYAYYAQRAGFGDTAGDPTQGATLYRKGIPPEVLAVIKSYNEDKYHLAMVTTDGIDIATENERKWTPGGLSRWSGWQS